MRHPEWIRSTLSGTYETKKVLRKHRVFTVCEEARCPNQGKCFSGGTATFLILGDKCTRNCSFCAVESAEPLPPDPHEPERVADAAASLGLRFVVITSVTRDDLPDKGAEHFRETIHALRRRDGSLKIEVLTPDFRGDEHALRKVLEAGPDVFNHNVETVPRLYPAVRPGADYRVSLDLLKKAKGLYPGIRTKSGIMVGMGEREEEVLAVMADLRDSGCEFLTIGQYLRPGKRNMPVAEYILPEIFEHYREKAIAAGFVMVASSPLTRSSMNAEEMFGKNADKHSVSAKLRDLF